MTDLGPAKWRGKAGRHEVWYLTATDAATGAGIWVHHELVAPSGSEAPYAHGWTAVFPPDHPPVLERFGPEPVPRRDAAGGGGRTVAGCTFDGSRVCGAAGVLSWDLTCDDGSPPLWTFPERAWERNLLPGAQYVPMPAATVGGEVSVAGRPLRFDGRGAIARIYGHGSAERWGWLHADLDGEGVLEIVTAIARRPGLRRLPPLAFVQLRVDGEADWPKRPLAAAPRFRTTLRDDGFEVRGRAQGRKLRVAVEIGDGDAVTLGYVDPDGSTATCTNTERASATITLDDGTAGPPRIWRLDHRAHAELGTRP